MEKQLFLKQKDYEMIKFKSEIKLNQSIHDPLINPSHKNKNQKHKTTIKKQLINKDYEHKKINPLANTNKHETIKSSLINTNDKLQTDQTKIQTPWTKILQLFIKNYDFLNQPMDLQIVNPFGSYGLKVQQQLKSIANKNSISKIESKIQEGDDVSKISLKTYLKVLELMKKDLEKKWEQEEKVACLQIAIQACKLLHDSSNAKFQALKFAYVIEIVDRFGILVFQRIKKLSFPHLIGQKLQQITIKVVQQSNIPQAAQQICRNWLLKIASIRQLMPRIIIQTTLLRLHFFINNGVKARSSFERLYKSNRCFGEKMNCLFFSTFLVRIGRQVLPQDKDYIIQLLQDVFFYIKQGKNKFCRNDVTYDEYFKMLEPFFITSFQCLAENLQKEKFKRFFISVQQSNPHYIILKQLCLSFRASNLAIYGLDIVRMIQKLPEDQKYEVYRVLLNQIRAMVFNQSGQLIVLVWSDINKLTNIEIVLQLLGPFSQIIFKNLPSYQKNKFYGLILDKFSSMFEGLNQRKMNKKLIQKFEDFLISIIHRTQNIKDIATLQPFLQLISYFHQKSKQHISFNIVKTFINKNNDKINDPIIIHIMFSLIKNISGFKTGKNSSNHEVQEYVIKFLDKVDYESKELEEPLIFFGQIRANFGYLQKVITSLIFKAAGLTFKVRRLAKGRVTNKVISFLQAAVAFCYITVPVIECQQLKLKLYIYLCELALANNLISQATSFIKTCITQLSLCTLKTDIQLYDIFSRIIAFMIVVPDDPEKEHLFLFNGLYQAFQVSKWKSNYQSVLKFLFYTHSIRYLSCQAQQKLPFHIEGVTSNDGLFKSQDFKQCLIEKIYQICQNLEKTLEKVPNVSNDAEFDFYTIINLPEAVMSIIDIFDESDRLKKILTKAVKVLTPIKDRTLRKQLGINHQRIKKTIDGLNQKLKQCGFPNIQIL